MEIRIENCNSIDEASISVEPGRLNIKYGPNGTGKSTIARAIELSARNAGDLSELMPFKYRGKDGEKRIPKISGSENFKSALVFNEEYVSKFVFQQDEVVKNSFEIFIKNEEYERRMADIDKLIAQIKDTFVKNKNIDQVVSDLGELSESFGKSQTGFSKAGKMAKALAGGNKLEHIPESLVCYEKFIRSGVNVKWIGWQIKGNEFFGISDDCPYCAAPVQERKESILAVEKEYDARSVEHLLGLKAVVDRLGKYFSVEASQNITKIFLNKTQLKAEEIDYLVSLKRQIDILRQKMLDLKTISFFALRDVGEVKKKIIDLEINLEFLSAMDSDETRLIVEEVNGSLRLVLERVGQLQGEINKQKNGIETAIKKYKNEINGFLHYAGYKYAVDIEAEGDSYKMKLKHLEFSEHIQNGSRHLSYGERNAFSIVLFMYECLVKAPDLVVLDDPISSFDKNKKFAILEMLFRGKSNLRDKTVLLLTHDIEPLIDMMKSLAHKFQPSAVGSFLCSKGGLVTELSVTRNDLMTFAQICEQNVASLGDDIIKAIYLRRHYEIVNDKGMEYQLISSLLHKKPVPTVLSGGIDRNMTDVEAAGAEAAIRKKLPTFDYSAMLGRLNDNEAMRQAYSSAKNGYEKIQLFRVINNDNHDNDVIRKYINESFHIENEYIMQLDPHKYDSVPDYIVLECDKAIGMN